MYTSFLHIHSFTRYILLVLLVVVIVKSLIGWLSRSQFSKGDNVLAVMNMGFAHLQVIIGLILYYQSPNVKLGEGMMTNAFRYWSVEHLSLMLVAVILISIGRISSKKAKDDSTKHKRLFIYNALALLLIVVSVLQSGRGLL